VTRADWQQIAEERLLAAQALLAAHNWSSAYYLAGYAIECGLKSCILARLASAPELIFLEKRFSEKCWTHEIEELVKLAGLEAARTAAINANPALGPNWLLVANWNERSRYQMKTQAEAEALCNAIADNVNGVMPWTRARW
jgi:HEPN domain-containing protein